MRTKSNPRVLIFVADDYEDLEVWYPKLRLLEAGASVVLAGPEVGRRYVGKHGYPCVSDAAINAITSAAFDGVVLAGGWMPDKLRRDPRVCAAIREFDATRKLIAAICHGGWMAISADVYRGVRVTGSPGIRDDLVNAGAQFEDAEVVVDRHHVTSRRPDDLPAFMTKVLEFLG